MPDTHRLLLSPGKVTAERIQQERVNNG